MADFGYFLETFIGSLAHNDFYQGKSLPDYLQHPPEGRSNDEADIVDNKVVVALVRALGYDASEVTYNRSGEGGRRPDFVVRIPLDEYPKPCAVIESKNTATQNLEAHLPQLEGYLRAQGAQRGILIDGKRLLAFELANPAPVATTDLPLWFLVALWRGESPYAEGKAGAAALAVETNKTEQTKLLAFWRRFNRGAYTDSSRLILELTRTRDGQPHAQDGSTWNDTHAQLSIRKPDDLHLVGEIRSLISDVRTDVEAQLELRLRRYDEFREQLEHLPGGDVKASDEYGGLLKALLASLEKINISAEARNSLQFRLEGQLENLTERNLATGVGAELLRLVNEQLALNALGVAPSKDTSEAQAVFEGAQEAPKPKRGARKQVTLQDDLRATLERMQRLLSEFHERREGLAEHYRPEVAVFGAFRMWREKVGTVLLRGAAPERLRREFALQTSYVLIVRMLLVRILEDKGLLERVFTNGGLSLWFDRVEPRYLKYAQGRGTDYLLEMAYTSAQHVYAHFYTERLLFDWYDPERNLVIRILHRLAGYDLSTINDDIIGHVYGGYVEDAHKHESGMYYTPPEVVEYILDRLGYRGPDIIGKKILDPACGSGTFLVSAARRLVEAHREYYGGQVPPGEIQSVLDTVKGSLYGLDLNPFACYLAETNLLIQVLDLIKGALDADESVSLDRFHVYNTDTLTFDTKTLALVKGTLAFPTDSLPTAEKIKAKRGKLNETSDVDFSQGFEFLVANPPYVKANEGSEGLLEYRANIKKEHPFPEVRGVLVKKWDLFVPFVALGWSLLGEGGRMGMITSSGIEAVPYAEELRTFLAQNAQIDELSFFPGVRLFDDAQVESTVFFSSRNKPDTAHETLQRWHIGKPPSVGREKRLSQLEFGEQVFRQQMAASSSADTVQLDEICYVSKGMVLHSHEGEYPNLFKKDELISVTKDAKHPVAYAEGKDIDCYEVTQLNYIEYGFGLRAPSMISRPTFAALYDSPKLIAQRSVASRHERVCQVVMDLGDWDGHLRTNESGVVLMPWHNLAGVENRSIGPAKDDERQRKEEVSRGYDLAFLAGVLNSAWVSDYLRSARRHSIHIFPEDFKDVPVPCVEPNEQKGIAECATALHKLGLHFSSLRRQGWRVNSSTNVVIAPALLTDGVAALPLSSAKIRWGLDVHDKTADLTKLVPSGRSLYRRRQAVLSVPETVPEAALGWLRRQFAGLEPGTSLEVAEARGLRVPASPEEAVKALRELEAQEAGVREKIGEFNRLKVEVDTLVAAIYEGSAEAPSA